MQVGRVEPSSTIEQRLETVLAATALLRLRIVLLALDPHERVTLANDPYVAAETSNTVSVIDTRSNQVVASFLVHPRPRAAE